MDTFTIYFDVEHPRRIKRFWWSYSVFFTGFFIYQGWRYLTHIHGLAEWILGIINIFGAVAIVTTGIINLYTSKKFGRPRVVFSNEGLEIKTKQRGHAEKISWDEIQAMHLKINGVEIIPKAQSAHPIEILAGTCSYTQFQQIKKNLKKYSAKYHVESNF